MENTIQHATQILILTFLAITFLQSGMDKMLDWKGNLGFMRGHFSKTAFKDYVPALLGVATVLEMLSGILAGVGAIQLMIDGKSSIGFLGAVIAALTLMFLFLGQRIAKDYAGAQTLVVYLIPTVFLVFLMQG